MKRIDEVRKFDFGKQRQYFDMVAVLKEFMQQLQEADESVANDHLWCIALGLYEEFTGRPYGQ